MPKYLNSPQSAIFDKSALLFGLDLAEEAIRRERPGRHRRGVHGCHRRPPIRLPECRCRRWAPPSPSSRSGSVKRLSRNIVLALDADAAGQGATVRSLECCRAPWTMS